MKSGPWRTHSRNEHQSTIAATDRAVSLMIRERDRNEPCIACGKPHKEYDAGHYRRRELMSTRFHPMNLNREGKGCNRGTHNTKYAMKDMDLYRENVDKKWGAGTAQFLYKLSQTIEPWETRELEQLRTAARMGPRAYEQLYFELRPSHRY
ncbi:MAG TPA: recombination protein NinG [Terracidiphilus sp.]|nr:recombination protein NinG [Terracidiphilus sp.]